MNELWLVTYAYEMQGKRKRYAQVTDIKAYARKLYNYFKSQPGAYDVKMEKIR